MIERFQGADGQAVLIEELRRQELIGNDQTLATEVAGHATLRQFERGDVIIRQGDADTDMYFILVGEVEIGIRGKQDRASRGQRTHVGEMAAIESQPRSATVRAVSRVVVAALSRSEVLRIGNSHPDFFLRMARTLAQRLRERNDREAERRERPRVFVISSSESSNVLPIIVQHLGQVADVVPWTQGVFALSQYSLESLEEQLKCTDFAIAIAGADDLTTSRGVEHPVPRDNVVLEYGMFLGKLGRHRAILMERGGVRSPSDLLGLTVARFDPTASDPNEMSVSSVCKEIVAHINKYHL